MYKAILFAVVAGFGLFQFSENYSQPLQGVITYESKINMHRRLPPDRQEMKSMIPEFRVSKEQLFFNEKESVYKPLIEDDPEEFDNGGEMRVRMANPYFEYYQNSETNTIVSKREFMGKNYLINNELKVAPWKFSNEVKKIQGYDCKQAYYTNSDNQVVTAWYTTEIRSFLGPSSYGTLPGTILALDINSEDQVYLAINIELKEIKKNDLSLPKGGEETTSEAFQKMVEERMKQMGGHVILRN